MDFKNINILVGMAALFSTISITPYASEMDKVDINSSLESKIDDSKIYTILTPLNEVTSKEFKTYKEYSEYAKEILSSNTSQIFLTEDVGNNYVIYMIPYIEAGIIMNLGFLKYSQNSEINKMIQNVTEAQEVKVKIMQKLLEQGELRGNLNKEFGEKIHKRMTKVVKKIKVFDKKDTNFEEIRNYYIKNMILYYEDTNEVSREYLKYGKNKELLAIVQNMLILQEREIEELKGISKENEV